jgi:hypothetical protein
MNILLGDFNAKVGMKDIFKPTIWNERPHEITNDNGVRVVNFATSKNLLSNALSLITTFIHKPGYLLWERHTTRLITF